MNCKINPQVINPHIKAAFNKAKVMGITGQIINVDATGDNIAVMFTHNSDGDAKNQIFPMDASWVTVEV